MPPAPLLWAVLVVYGLSLATALLLLWRLRRRDAADPTAALAQALERALREELRAEMRSAREEQAAGARALREELQGAGKQTSDTVVRLFGELRDAQAAQTRELAERVGAAIAALQSGNERKLEEMRVTVDEKLHGTLERRLGESFALVSERLEAVQRGLGEMQTLASGVGDLKRVLTNVKTRGVWGEYQLEAILEQLLTPEQYVRNWRPRDDGREVVEFAIRLPGSGPDAEPVFLPVDAKFPQEDYQRLLDAADRADAEAMHAATAALVRAVRLMARDICDKYLVPPRSTDFAILFLPTEGLYAEVLRQPGLVQELQARCQVIVAGPTTLSAILSSLRMGFRTLAIEQRSGEVWEVLGAVKTEFGKFGEVLDRVKRQLEAAGNSIDETGRRTRVMERRLREVEAVPVERAAALLEPAAVDEAIFPR